MRFYPHGWRSIAYTPTPGSNGMGVGVGGWVLPRTAPPFGRMDAKGIAGIRLDTVAAATFHILPRSPSSAAGSCYVVDFGAIIQGGINATFAAGRDGQQVTVYAGETLHPDGTVKWWEDNLNDTECVTTLSRPTTLSRLTTLSHHALAAENLLGGTAGLQQAAARAACRLLRLFSADVHSSDDVIAFEGTAMSGRCGMGSRRSHRTSTRKLVTGRSAMPRSHQRTHGSAGGGCGSRWVRLSPHSTPMKQCRRCRWNGIQRCSPR